MRNIMRKPITLATTGVLLCLAAVEFAFAASGSGASGGIGAVAENVSSNLSALAKLLTGASFVGGIGFVIASLFKFKQHKDTPQQVTIGTPIMLLVIGASLIFLPNVVKMGGATVFGDDASTAGTSGSYDFTK